MHDVDPTHDTHCDLHELCLDPDDNPTPHSPIDGIPGHTCAVCNNYCSCAYIKLVRRSQDSRSGFDDILRAWTNAGPRRDIHTQAQVFLRREWPVLADALDRAVALHETLDPISQACGNLEHALCGRIKCGCSCHIIGGRTPLT